MIKLNENYRMKPIEAARQFINNYFPFCQGALLAGSVIRGNATKTSDLDIIVFDSYLASPYRESLIFSGWPVEVFVHNLTSYKKLFISDFECARPTHPQMIAEGVILVDHGVITPIKIEAKQFLFNGPEPWSEEKIYNKRYFITDALEDLIGSSDRGEQICIAGTLADWIHEFVLRTNNQWLGDSKWIIRALKKYDEHFAAVFTEAFDSFYKTGNKSKIITLVDEVLKPYGGRLFHGFSIGKK